MVQSKEGKLFASVDGDLVEVVLSDKASLAQVSAPSKQPETDRCQIPYELAEGVYAVGSGSSGVAPALAVMGAAYAAIMLISAATIRRPAPGYCPPGWTPPSHPGSVSGSAYTQYRPQVLTLRPHGPWS